MNEMITSPHEQQNEDYPQLTIADTDWTDEEQSTMREHGYDNNGYAESVAAIARRKSDAMMPLVS